MKLLSIKKNGSSLNTDNIQDNINSKVIGILKYNNKIRENLLHRNIGKYSLSNLDEGIGYISNIYSNEYNKPISLGENGLLGYTHQLDSNYQAQIHNNNNIKNTISYYQNNMVPNGNYSKYDTNYVDYVEYINDFFGLNLSSNLPQQFFSSIDNNNILNSLKKWGNELSVQSALHDFMRFDSMHNAMEQMKIGIIRPNPQIALEGEITTNLYNNKQESKLGIITNLLYAQMLERSAHFNDLRRTKYITPNAYKNIGVKHNTLDELDDLFKINPNTGRLSHEISIDNSTLDCENMSFDSFNNGSMDFFDVFVQEASSSQHARYQNLKRNINKYLPFQRYTTDLGTNLVSSYGPVISNYLQYKIWNEGEYQVIPVVNKSTNIGTYQGYDDFKEGSLLYKTNEFFRTSVDSGIDTIIGRFHTSGGRDATHNEVNLLQTAISCYGMSHGRNLLNKNAYENYITDKTNGYDNPYCRTWTYHHQYDRAYDLIRPLKDENKQTLDFTQIRKNLHLYGGNDTNDRLNKYSKLNSKTGFINITPTNENNGKVDITQCMFSIENLAWKDVLLDSANNSLKYRGPNGGRIMWFPPYNLKFSENVNVNWNPNSFIGRGENIYTYTNTDRGGVLSFTLLVDHPSILDIWRKHGATGEKNNDEQKILRFFAGNELLVVHDIEQYTLDTLNKKESNDNLISNNDYNPTISFYVFFPHNYSGYQEKDVDIWEYLANNYEVGTEDRVPCANRQKIYNGYDYTYRVDKTYLDSYTKNTIFQNNKWSFCDTTNFNLNDNLDAVNENKCIDDLKATHTFVDIYKNSKDIIGDNIVESVTVLGYGANIDGGKEESEIVNRRTRLISNLLRKLSIRSEKYIKDPSSSFISFTKNISEIANNISGREVKEARCAFVKIKLKTNIEEIVDNTGGESSAIVAEQTVKTISKREERRNRKGNKKEKKNQNDSRKLDSDSNQVINYEKEQVNSNDFENENILQNSRENTLKNSEDYEATRSRLNKINRWEDESEYFELLQDNDSVLYNKIIDKVKYFSPAFHSITPEGFNARLSFLHQCTRQGATLAASDSQSVRGVRQHAGNMAFGRPPICVLRIGDFYNTKIIIESISIDYDETHWDMNPEGIGIQPMYANISLNFKFLGGSDIGAPISRLQNALSFNYYANQSVYDDRADKGQYYNKSNRIIGTPWKPLSGN